MMLRQWLSSLVLLLVLQTALLSRAQALSVTDFTDPTAHRFVFSAQPDRTAAQWQRQGNQQYQAGQLEAAVRSWQHARTLYQQLPDLMGEAVTLTSLGAVYLQLERYRQAIASLEAFLPLAPRLNDRRMTAQVLSNLGIADAALGNYARAIASQQQAGKLMQTLGDRQGLGQVLVNLGNVFEAVGDYDKATIAYQQSLKIARQANNPASEGVALGNLGSVYSKLGQYDDAIAAQQRSLELAKTTGNRSGQAVALLNLGTAYHARGDRTRAIDYYTDSLVIAKQLNHRKQTAEALGSLGLAYEDLKDYTKSIADYEQSLAIVQTLDDPQLAGLTLNNLGHALFGAGKLAEAERRLREAIAKLDALRPGLSDTYKASIFDTQIYTYNLLQQILLAAQQPEAALEITEHGRARAFVELLARRGQGKSSEEAKGAGGSVREAGEPNAKTPDDRDPAQTPDHQEPPLTVPLAVQPISIAAIKAVAQQQNATLVEYAIVPDDDFKAQGKQRARESELLIWVVQPTGEVAFRRVDLKPLWQNGATLVDVVRLARCLTPQVDCGAPAPKVSEPGSVEVAPPSGFSQLQMTPTASSPGETASSPGETASSPGETASSPGEQVGKRRLRKQPGLRKLYQLLIEPIATLLPVKPNARIVFIPQESLFLVPFAALQAADGSYFIEQHTILTAPAIQVLELTRQQQARGRARNGRSPHSALLAPRSALIIGNPTMPTVSTEPGQPPEQLPPLPGAEKEAIAIAQLIGTQALTGKQANKASILKRLATARVVHFATHGLLEYGSQGTSLKGLEIPGAIALAPSQGDDGLLTASEVLNLHLTAELVTLSACDTGQGRITGDGVIGLSRAFIAAGVPSLVVSLWAVSDTATAKLMTTFYHALQQQPDKAQALRQAMLITMKDYPYPIDWAAFTLIGEAE